MEPVRSRPPAMADALVTLSAMAKAASDQPAAGVREPFAAALKKALGQVSEIQSRASSLAEQFELGERSVSLEETVIAGQKASLAFQAVLQVRNRVVQAYQEIMQMNV